MTPPIHLALVVEAPEVSLRAVSEIAAALQRQLTRDLAPIWEVNATIDAFVSLKHVPPGDRPILVGDNFPGVESVGIHLDRNGQPFALVEASPSWSLTASHEAIEMVIDPWATEPCRAVRRWRAKDWWRSWSRCATPLAAPSGPTRSTATSSRTSAPQLLRSGRRTRRPLQLHRRADRAAPGIGGRLSVVARSGDR